MRKRLFGNGGGANIDQIISSISVKFSSEGYDRVNWEFIIQDYKYRVFTEDYTSTAQLYPFQDSHDFQMAIEQYGQSLTGSSPIMEITVYYNDADQLEEISSTYDSRVASLKVVNNPDTYIPHLQLTFSVYNPGNYILYTSFIIDLRVNGDNDNLLHIKGNIF